MIVNETAIHKIVKTKWFNFYRSPYGLQQWSKSNYVKYMIYRQFMYNARKKILIFHCMSLRNRKEIPALLSISSCFVMSTDKPDISRHCTYIVFILQKKCSPEKCKRNIINKEKSWHWLWTGIKKGLWK